MASWYQLPEEIRRAVLDPLLHDGCRLADFATVSREWQAIIEKHTFSRIKLTPSRIGQLGSMVPHHRRSLVGYIWLCLELPEYDCLMCDPQDQDSWGLSSTGNILVTKSFQALFSTLSVWEPSGSLLLDISIYSPSDSEHWFKYLTFEPDVLANTSGQDQHAIQTMLAKAKAKTEVTDHHHGWVAGSRKSVPSDTAVEKLFEEIMDLGPFDDDEEESQWWKQLPLVPAITGVLLRQQNRRRWRPATLGHIFALLPGLQEIHYEPWREWLDIQQRWTDESFCLLLDSFSSDRLRRLVLFENFDQTYPASFTNLGCDPVRIPSSHVSRAVANASFSLEHLSASFIVEASQFFDIRELSWTWPNLTWLALTSRLLKPHESPTELDNMLKAAAEAAMKMPSLETMEIWNGDKGLAMFFRHQSAKGAQPAVITCRGTWELTLRPLVIQAWDAVAMRDRGQGHVIVKEVLDAGVDIRCHGDAIRHLNLSKPIIRPVSLRQIQMEYMLREGVQIQ
ncbi:hypothetical protein ONS96_000708 [Cadophora gregata f. sp. sojae]|nr:hypothetical protein ONS96_000708 [Cadophora gregata f. sp. sojae]